MGNRKDIRFENDWRFCIDEKKTQDFYRVRPITLSKPNDRWPGLAAFLNEMGADIQKPIAFAPDEMDLCYIVFGTAEAAEGYELDFYEPENFVSVAVYFKEQIDESLKKNAEIMFEDDDIILLEVFIV